MAVRADDQQFSSRVPAHTSNDELNFGPFLVAILVVMGAAASLLALLYLLGAVLQFLRRTAGRVLVIVASALGSALAIFALAYDAVCGGHG